MDPILHIAPVKGDERSYEPDFIVRLVSDLNLLLEIKGFEVHNPGLNEAKHRAARRWIEAVNNLGEFGRWDFLVCRELAELGSNLTKIAAVLPSVPAKSTAS